ncbi:MAG TPA: GNAT family N-acetyltransferase [Acidimicrobiales bacterium]
MIEVKDNRGESRFDVFEDGRLAGFARYVRRGGRIIFVHTEVDPELEGRGIGSKLAAGALDAARASGERVVPLCPFIASRIDRDPAYADLVDTRVMSVLDSEPPGPDRVDEVADELAVEGGFD